jgi:hypothetical protein
MMIEAFKRQDGEGLGANKVGEGSGENIPEPPKTHHKNQLETLDPRERPHKQGPLKSPKSENHQAETTPQNPHPTAGTQKANCTQAIE